MTTLTRVTRRWSAVGWVLALVGLSGCAIIGPGERGVRRTLGKIEHKVLEPGPALFNPLFTDVMLVVVQTRNVEVRLSLPSKEGLTIESDISILYRIQPDMVPSIVENVGLEYERSIILSTFHSAAAAITARHYAKDMHTGRRAEIEQEIAASMNSLIVPRGFEVEAVLLKSITLPARLTQAIEARLQAEQEAMRMEFVLQHERLEAERRVTEAKGIRDAQQIITDGLTPLLIQYRSIEAFQALATSPNAKVVFTDGRSPLLLSADPAPAPAVTPPPRPGAAPVAPASSSRPRETREPRPASGTPPAAPVPVYPDEGE
jgi:regulator of protease activity HflC (stomatin/prohibitin superfamily)